MDNAWLWIGLNLFSIIVLAFYSMQEMACVSLNKIRLQYYVSKGNKRALWLNYMLQDPARLFGTTLLGVNIAMMVGSEFARESYLALGLDPDLAPLTQVIIVVVFAELAPMFAARRYAEHVAMLGAPILYASAKIMTPLLWTIGWISKFANFIVGGKEAPPHVLNREDLQKILEEQDEDRPVESEGADFNTVTWNIFSLRNKDARQVMQPISKVTLIPSTATVEQLRNLLKKAGAELVPVYHRDIHHIIGIASPRDLIRVPDTRKVRDHITPPWFIVQHMKVARILTECRRNNKNMAIVLDEQGLAIGVITLTDLIEEIFGEYKNPRGLEAPEQQGLIIDRTFPGDYTVREFNKQFDVVLDKNEDLTLEELMTNNLGHHPEEGETIYLAPFELTVKEASLMEVKKVTISSRI